MPYPTFQKKKKEKRLFKKLARQFNDQFLLWRCHCKQAFPVISVYVYLRSQEKGERYQRADDL